MGKGNDDVDRRDVEGSVAELNRRIGEYDSTQHVIRFLNF
jgi:hypothetical protein